MIPTLSPATAGSDLPLAGFAALAGRHGFQGVEFSIEEAELIRELEGMSAVESHFLSAGVVPAAFRLPVDWETGEERFAFGRARLPAHAALAARLCCMRCWTPVRPDNGEAVADYKRRAIRRLAQVARILDGHGVQLGIEFLGPNHFRPDPGNEWFHDVPGALRAVEEIARAAGVANIGLLLDCWHWFTSNGTPDDLRSIPADKIVHVHVSDAPKLRRDEQEDGARLLPGASGVIAISSFLKVIESKGYEGPVAVETVNPNLEALSAEEAAAQAAAALRDVLQAADTAGWETFATGEEKEAVDNPLGAHRRGFSPQAQRGCSAASLLARGRRSKRLRVTSL